MEKFKDKYRIQSTRMPGWDYSRGGKYYVTICTRNRVCCFGEVINGAMRLNEIGKIVNDLWLKIPEHFNNTWLDDHIVMPNHIHGIVVMKRSDTMNNLNQPVQSIQPVRRDAINRISTCRKTCRNYPDNRIIIQKNTNP